MRWIKFFEDYTFFIKEIQLNKDYIDKIILCIAFFIFLIIFRWSIMILKIFIDSLNLLGNIFYFIFQIIQTVICFIKKIIYYFMKINFIISKLFYQIIKFCIYMFKISFLKIQNILFYFKTSLQRKKKIENTEEDKILNS